MGHADKPRFPGGGRTCVACPDLSAGYFLDSSHRLKNCDDIRHWRTLEWVELVETSVFTRQVTELLSDDEYRRFQFHLTANPAAGPLIRGGGGIRKIRVAVGTRGKSGGARIIYYWAEQRDVILLLFAYRKSVAADLTPKQIAELARVVKREFEDESKIV